MPSTRKQKAKAKRSRQSDVMSDIENLDVMLGGYQRDNSEIQDRTSENEIDSESNRQGGSSNQNENNYRSYLNTNLSENSCLTVETRKVISSEISSQISRKFEKLQSSLNSQILDVINAAIDTRVLPSMKNAVRRQNSAKNTSVDLRSDGLHSENVNKSAQDAQNEFPRLLSIKSSQTNHCRENSLDS